MRGRDRPTISLVREWGTSYRTTGGVDAGSRYNGGKKTLREIKKKVLITLAKSEKGSRHDRVVECWCCKFNQFWFLWAVSSSEGPTLWNSQKPDFPFRKRNRNGSRTPNGSNDLCETREATLMTEWWRHGEQWTVRCRTQMDYLHGLFCRNFFHLQLFYDDTVSASRRTHLISWRSSIRSMSMHASCTYVSFFFTSAPSRIIWHWK